jgi:hypothetical protein
VATFALGSAAEMSYGYEYCEPLMLVLLLVEKKLVLGLVLHFE